MKVYFLDPPLLPKIFDILVRCISQKYTIISDMQSAFLNIRVAEEDRDFSRFLWVKDIVQKDFELIVKRFASVMFGLTCSPSLLSMTVRHHVLNYLNFNENLVMKFLSDFYMDDFIPTSSGPTADHPFICNYLIFIFFFKAEIYTYTQIFDVKNSIFP